MSMLSKSNPIPNMGTPLFNEFKKQASFFLREKIKTARLVLTDVTPAQLLTEEAISGETSASPETRILGRISRAAFEVDDYWRIVDILHDRLSRFDKRNWRLSYNSMIVLEHLLTHGPESVAEEFQSDRDAIAWIGTFQFIDERGFNWGLAVRKKSERLLKLLEKGPLLKEERVQARKVSREIHGFGSFSRRAPSPQGVLQDSSFMPYGRCNSCFENQENRGPEQDSVKKVEEPEQKCENVVEVPDSAKERENPKPTFSPCDEASLKIYQCITSFKENLEPSKQAISTGQHRWNNGSAESRPLLDGKPDDYGRGIDAEDDHPFNDAHRCSESLLMKT